MIYLFSVLRVPVTVIQGRDKIKCHYVIIAHCVTQYADEDEDCLISSIAMV